MNEKILRFLALSYLEDEGNFGNIRPVSFDDQKNDREKLEKLMNKYHFDIDDQNLLEADIIGEMTYRLEWNGFIHGLKVSTV